MVMILAIMVSLLWFLFAVADFFEQWCILLLLFIGFTLSVLHACLCCAFHTVAQRTNITVIETLMYLVGL